MIWVVIAIATVVVTLVGVVFYDVDGDYGSSVPAIAATLVFWSVLVLAISFLTLPVSILIVVACFALIILAIASWGLRTGRPSPAVKQSIMDQAEFTSTAGLDPPNNRLPGWYPARVPGQRGFRWWDPYANGGEGAFTLYRGHANDYTIGRWNNARSTSIGVAVAMISVAVAVVMLAALLGQLALMEFFALGG